MAAALIVVIDNYDSFVHNLARYVRLAGATTEILRNDAASVDDLLAMTPSALVLSPGPKTPKDAGICLALLKALPASIPVLGVCLGHQCLVEVFGGRTVRARHPKHGRASVIEHNGRGLFARLPRPMRAGLYHSLVSETAEDGGLRVTARSEQGDVMAVEAMDRPWFGVQFHPESVLTPDGEEIVRNFVAMAS